MRWIRPALLWGSAPTNRPFVSSPPTSGRGSREANPTGFLTLPGPLDLLDWSVGAFSGFFGAASSLVPGARTQTREFQNQLHALEWFAFACQRVPLPDRDSLHQWFERAGRIELDHRPWATEGAAYYAARAEFARGPRRGFLHEDYPEWTRTVLHTGLGLALGQLMLPYLPTERKMAEALAAFVSLVLENSQSGYEGAALEQLGVIVRHMHFGRTAEFDRLLKQGAPELREYFWHGFGRGSYLAPGNMTPWSGSGWRAIQEVSKIAPDQSARKNAISGASWAFTLVNLRTPEVMQDFMTEHGSWVQKEDAFSDGVRSEIGRAHV